MDNLENKADEFAKKMEEAANDGWNIVDSGANKVEGAASDAKETAAEVAKDAWNTVEDTADKAKETAGDAWNKVEDAADSAADKVTEKVDDAWGKVEDASEPVADKAGNAWDKVEDSTDKTAVKVGETFTKIGGETTDAWATTAAVQGADAPVINAWKKIDEDARKLEAQMNTAADSGWNKTESAAHEAEKAVEQASADVFTPAAAAPEVSSWQAETPVEPFGEPATPAKLEDTWTAPVFTPTPVQTQSIGSGGYVPPVSPSTAQKKFPTWAIILIVLLVLCVCGGLGIWIITIILGGTGDGASLFLPLLM